MLKRERAEDNAYVERERERERERESEREREREREKENDVYAKWISGRIIKQDRLELSYHCISVLPLPFLVWDSHCNNACMCGG